MVEEVKQINECTLTPTNYYVYLHTKPDTGELFYVGKGKGTRFCEHRNRNKYWTHVSNKHGFTSQVIMAGLPEKCALEIENLLITLYREDHSINLANISDGPGSAGMGKQVICVDNGMIFKDLNYAIEWINSFGFNIRHIAINGKNRVKSLYFEYYDPSKEYPASNPNAKPQEPLQKIICLENGMIFKSSAEAEFWIRRCGIKIIQKKGIIGESIRNGEKLKGLTFEYYDPTKTYTPTNIHAIPQEPRKKGTTHDKRTE